jgi:hypothetical protein
MVIVTDFSAAACAAGLGVRGAGRGGGRPLSAEEHHPTSHQKKTDTASKGECESVFLSSVPF